MQFSEILSTLPSIEHLATIVLYQDGNVLARIENQPGSAGSVRVYHALINAASQIDQAAAQQGLAWYAEHTDDARLHPGKHPNIDRLLQLLQAAPGSFYTAELIRK
ncbi:DUF2322 family protein [Undibacterium rugosum]|uniref:DUF2322 family protein n=1 Tax=Undibacterium rugosum TaxID=2762291 RepID=A0A923I0J4_9BURK|nr:DUF2322 family protein [Undibacterium rugosum]MBC3934787.1 DUF2322 family protein [Undibacterium rugosum]MBR7778363.1 DUF2322 family protein [Undibacterium rugosum]